MININSFSKTFSLCGIRVGYLCSRNQDLIKKVVELKTYTSMNLGLSMAMERNNTVLLIDSDVVKGSLSKLLGLDGSLGLVDLLLNPKLYSHANGLPSRLRRPNRSHPFSWAREISLS